MIEYWLFTEIHNQNIFFQVIKSRKGLSLNYFYLNFEIEI